MEARSITEETAVPSLKVMRLQSPHLSVLDGITTKSAIQNSMRLPESFGVIHVGESFTAYIGAINNSQHLNVLGLNVTAQLQTPSKRIPLPSQLENVNLSIPPGKGKDFLISQALEEDGQHILRVEVGYISSGGPSGPQPKTLRKFYRFNVSSPMDIKALAKRGGGDASIFVSISATNSTKDIHTIHEIEFQPPFGLIGEMVDLSKKSSSSDQTFSKTTDLYDTSGILDPGATRRFLFLVKASSQDALLRGIAVGDELGHAIISWKKAMGESGRIASATVFCPPSEVLDKDDDFVVHNSGLSVDVAAVAAKKSSTHSSMNKNDLDSILPVTVEPIDPPTYMTLYKPQEINLLVVNHSERSINLQLQMRLDQMKGVQICGNSFQNLGEVRPSGGSCVVPIKIIAFQNGLFKLRGCVVYDLDSGREIIQPNLFDIFVK